MTIDTRTRGEYLREQHGQAIQGIIDIFHDLKDELAKVKSAAAICAAMDAINSDSGERIYDSEPWKAFLKPVMGVIDRAETPAVHRCDRSQLQETVH